MTDTTALTNRLHSISLPRVKLPSQTPSDTSDGASSTSATSMFDVYPPTHKKLQYNALSRKLDVTALEYNATVIESLTKSYHKTAALEKYIKKQQRKRQFASECDIDDATTGKLIDARLTPLMGVDKMSIITEEGGRNTIQMIENLSDLDECVSEPQTTEEESDPERAKSEEPDCAASLKYDLLPKDILRLNSLLNSGQHLASDDSDDRLEVDHKSKVRLDGSISAGEVEQFEEQYQFLQHKWDKHRKHTRVRHRSGPLPKQRESGKKSTQDSTNIECDEISLIRWGRSRSKSTTSVTPRNR